MPPITGEAHLKTTTRYQHALTGTAALEPMENKGAGTGVGDGSLVCCFRERETLQASWEGLGLPEKRDYRVTQQLRFGAVREDLFGPLGPPGSSAAGPKTTGARSHSAVAGLPDSPSTASIHLPSLVEPCSLVTRPPDPSLSKALRSPPPWPPCSWQPPSPLVSKEAQSCRGQAGPLMEGADSSMTLDTRSASGCDVEDGASFLLSASPDWWLGSLEGRGASVPSRSMARSSLLDRAEPSFLTDIGPGSQELPDGPLEPWGSDAGCPSLALRDEVDSIFPDFFPC
ncbi:spermatogenesis- and oogenesis-specific basic helix-loop-helix-containing protein 1 [Puma concolor]|uniref:Spermatogenesis- and oogenesis-specific basic helix-loop-helix-containing protein 1 n=1 Tax=Puma concolor TaxID=9696 RepID=A0A6P6HVN9_PUMCO|nr:spermatogenesis- and oogenesis-specific basic helix-loop-helix-containing protein 1 [Puma concolor]